MNLYNLLFFIPIFFLECSAKVKTCKTEIVELETGGFVQERRYYNEEKILVALVNFNKSTLGKHEPTDSILYKLDERKSLIKSYHFNYSNGKYVLANYEVVNKFDENFYSQTMGCDGFNSLKNSYLLLESMNDICLISSSVLSNGKEVSELKKQNIDSSSGKIVTTMLYENLNSSFLGLSTEIDSNFYMQQLTSLKIIIVNSFLKKEDFSFASGKITREYIYDLKGVLLKKVLSINLLSNSKNEQIIVTYRYT